MKGLSENSALSSSMNIQMSFSFYTVTTKYCDYLRRMLDLNKNDNEIVDGERVDGERSEPIKDERGL